MVPYFMIEIMVMCLKLSKEHVQFTAFEFETSMTGKQPICVQWPNKYFSLFPFQQHSLKNLIQILQNKAVKCSLDAA